MFRKRKKIAASKAEIEIEVFETISLKKSHGVNPTQNPFAFRIFMHVLLLNFKLLNSIAAIKSLIALSNF